MNVVQKVYEALSASSAVTVLCPATRIKPPGPQQGQERPYIVHFPVTVDPLHTYGGRAALLVYTRYQISCFADSRLAADSLAEAVVGALDTAGSPGPFQWTGIGSYLWEQDTGVHQIALEFEVATEF